MKRQDYITDLYETRDRLFSDVLGFTGNEWMAFEVMAAGKTFMSNMEVATIMTMDKEHYIEGNGGYPYKVKLQNRTEGGKLERGGLINPALFDEFCFVPANDEGVSTLIARKMAQSRRLLMLEAGLCEAECYRLLISFDTAATPVQIAAYKAVVGHRWMYDFATTCPVAEARRIIDEYGRKTWNAAMEYSGITDNPYD